MGYPVIVQIARKKEIMKKKRTRKKEKANFKVVEIKGVPYLRKYYIRRGKPKTTYRKLK